MTDSSTSVAGAFFQAAREFSERPFLHLVADTASRYGQSATTFSYANGVSEVTRLVEHYRLLSVQRGQRVAIGLDNRPEFFFHWLALNCLGVSVVPLNPQWQSAELEYVIEHSETMLAVVLPEYVVRLQDAAQTGNNRCEVMSVDQIAAFETTDKETAEEAKNTLPEPLGQLDHECALLYTSGTTGRPKGCQLSNEYFLSSGAWYKSLGGYCALQSGQDRLITPLPMYHMNAMATSTMAMIMTGSCIVPLDRFHPRSWWQSIAECDATIMHYLGVMPAMLMGMSASADDSTHNIRFGFGAGLSGELHTAFEERFDIHLIEAWAMTETGCTVAVIASEEPRKVGTACFGRPPRHLDYQLVNDAGQAVTQGQPGELLVRRAGPAPRLGFFSGYLKDQHATDEAWKGGYFHTGDLVYLDDDGLMHFVDRKKNVIRRSGENISAVEVEEIIMELDGVHGVGVAAVPDELRGDEVFACVMLNEPATIEAAQIVRHCLSRLAYYKAPGYITFVQELPLTPTEKIQRARLKELAQEKLQVNDCEDMREMKSNRG